MSAPPIALTIAGSDPSGGAGIQADLKTFAAFGVYGASAITALTAQNTAGVTDVMTLAADFVTAQIEAIASDLPIAATKTGMLGTAAVVEAVAAAIADLDLSSVVVDPLLASSGGTRLLDDDGVQALCLELLPKALVVTPNIPEAEALSGCRIRTPSDARRAAERLHQMGAASVIITGGHAEGPDVVDLLFDGHRFIELKTRRIRAKRVHGTGCAFASALAAGLARGRSLRVAAASAQAYVAGVIRHARALGKGAALPAHFWKSARPTSARRRGPVY